MSAAFALRAGRVAAVGAAGSLVAICAPAAASPNSVRKMDATSIQTLKESKLCDAYAVWLGEGRSYPVIDNEIRRRGITCADAVETVVSDCSMLELAGIDPDSSPRGVIFTIRNKSQKLKAFRIYFRGIQSSHLSIGPGEVRSFGVAVDPRIARIGSVVSTLQGEGGPMLNECVTSRWGF